MANDKQQSKPITQEEMKAQKNDLGERVVAIARRYVGKYSYSLGASGDGDTLDCGLFTKKVFDEAGVDIGTRCADNQALHVRDNGGELYTADYDVPLPGDLVFYHNTYSCVTEENCGITHVGICTGDGMQIDCGSSSGVSERPIETFDKYSPIFGRLKELGIPASNQMKSANVGDGSTNHKSDGKSSSQSNYKGFQVTPTGTETVKITKLPKGKTYAEPIYPDLITVSDTVPQWVLDQIDKQELSRAQGTVENAQQALNSVDNATISQQDVNKVNKTSDASNKASANNIAVSNIAVAADSKMSATGLETLLAAEDAEDLVERNEFAVNGLDGFETISLNLSALDGLGDKNITTDALTASLASTHAMPQSQAQKLADIAVDYLKKKDTAQESANINADPAGKIVASTKDGMLSLAGNSSSGNEASAVPLNHANVIAGNSAGNIAPGDGGTRSSKAQMAAVTKTMSSGASPSDIAETAFKSIKDGIVTGVKQQAQTAIRSAAKSAITGALNQMAGSGSALGAVAKMAGMDFGATTGGGSKEDALGSEYGNFSSFGALVSSNISNGIGGAIGKTIGNMAGKAVDNAVDRGVSKVKAEINASFNSLNKALGNTGELLPKPQSAEYVERSNSNITNSTQAGSDTTEQAKLKKQLSELQKQEQEIRSRLTPLQSEWDRITSNWESIMKRDENYAGGLTVVQYGAQHFPGEYARVCELDNQMRPYMQQLLPLVQQEAELEKALANTYKH